MNTINGLKIGQKLAAICLIPIIISVILAGIIINSNLTELSVINNMSANLNIFIEASKLAGDIQRERCRTALYLSKGSDYQSVITLQESTDKTLKILLEALNKEALNDKNAALEVKSLGEKITGLRKKYKDAAADQCAEEIREYTEKGVNVVFSLQTAAANSKTSRGIGKQMTSLIILETARENAELLRANISSLISSNKALSDDELGLLIKLKANIESNIKSPALALDKTAKKHLEEVILKTEWAAVDTYHKNMLLHSKQGGYSINPEDFLRVISVQTDDIATVIQKNNDAMVPAMKKITADAKRDNFVIMCTMIATFVAVITLVYKISLGILRPLAGTTTMLKAISEGEGDLTKRLDVKTNDELGEMAVYFNIFISKIQSIVKNIFDNANTVASSSTELSTAFSQIAANSDSMAETTAKAAAAGEKAAANIIMISSAAKEMSGNADSVASAIEEMSVSISEVAKNCQKEFQIAKEANSYVKDSKEVIDNLGFAAQSIGKITEVINDIAEQTKLLALNATIEAARAGEHGRSFAVVAGEVKELARQTSEATRKISAQISDMQNNAKAAVKTIDLVTKVIEDVNIISQTIVSAVEQQSATVDNIAYNVSQMNRVSNEVAKNVADAAKDISDVSGSITLASATVTNTSHGIYQVNSNAEELAKLSEELKRIVSEFKF